LRASSPKPEARGGEKVSEELERAPTPEQVNDKGLALAELGRGEKA